MEKFILIFHFLVAVALIGLVLIQQGKGAEAGASFGAGASQTVFGSAGGWNFFSKATTVLATIFFATSLSLAITAKDKTVIDDFAVPPMGVYNLNCLWSQIYPPYPPMTECPTLISLISLSKI
jgi:preprotein translocase subunit SecG